MEGKVALFMDTYVGTGKPPLQVTVDFITRGESMGWSAVVEPFIYTLSARCLEDTKLISFDSEKFLDMMACYRFFLLNHERLPQAGEQCAPVLQKELFVSKKPIFN